MGGIAMSIYLVETYVLRVEKHAAYHQQLKGFLKYKEGHSMLFKGLKSWKLFKQDLGQPAGMYIEMWEYENYAEYEKNDGCIFADEGMKKISAEFHKLVEPNSFSATIWSSVV
jgi:hypothetical protein